MLEKLLSRPFLFLATLQGFLILISSLYSINYIKYFLLLISSLFICWLWLRKFNFLLLTIFFLSVTILLFRIKVHEFQEHRFQLKEYYELENSFLTINEIIKNGNTTYVLANLILNDDKVKVKLKLDSAQKSSNLYSGNIIRATLRLKANQVKETIENFNYTKHLDHQHIQFTGQIINDCFEITDSSINLYGLSSKLNNKLQEVIIQAIQDSQISKLIIALILGDKSGIDDRVKQQFISSGTAHILAVSGMHIGLLYGIIKFTLYKFSKKSYRNRMISCMITIISVWAFALVTGLGASILRASVMFSLIETGVNLKRISDPLNTLCATAFMMLFYNPCILYDLGFQLSFGAVLGIILFYPIVNRIFRYRYFILNQCLDIIKLSLAAQVFITPISLFHFNTFPTYFLLSNLIWVPLSSLLMILSIIMMTLSLFSSSLIQFLGKLISYLTKIGLDFFNAIEGLPFYQLKNIIISAPQVSFIFVGIIFIFLWTKFSNNLYLFAGIISILGFNTYPVINSFFNSSSTEIIFYTKSDKPFLELKAQKSIFIIGPKRDQLKSYFQNHYPSFQSTQYTFDKTESMLFEFQDSNEKISNQIGIDSIYPNIKLIILVKKFFHVNELRDACPERIFVHPSASPKLKSYYKIYDFSKLNITFASANTKIQI